MFMQRILGVGFRVWDLGLRAPVCRLVSSGQRLELRNPETLNLNLNAQPEALNVIFEAPNRKPKILHPKALTLNLSPET